MEQNVHKVEIDDDVELMRSGGVGNKLRFSASLKGWVATCVAILSIGFSVGLWASQGSNTAKELTQIHAAIDKMPQPDKIANKEIVDIQLKQMNDTLSEIKGEIRNLTLQTIRYQELLLRRVK